MGMEQYTPPKNLSLAVYNAPLISIALLIVIVLLECLGIIIKGVDAVDTYADVML
jgi:hypothetical protein